MDRYGDMEIALARQIARNQHLKRRHREYGASASSFVNFVRGKYKTMRKQLDESQLTTEFRVKLGKFKNKI